MEAWRKELYLAHAFGGGGGHMHSGREWKNHKYLYKEGNRYIYPEDVEAAKRAKNQDGPGAMNNDPRYQDQRGTGSDPRYKDQRGAMNNDPRYQDQRGAMNNDPRYKDQRGAMNNDPRYKEGPKSVARLKMEKNAKNYNPYSQKNIADRLKTREALNAKRRSEIEELKKREEVLNKNEWKVNGGKNYKDVGGRATDLRNEIYKKQAEINKTSGRSVIDDYENEHRRNVMKNVIEKNRKDRERRKHEDETGKYYAKNKVGSGILASKNALRNTRFEIEKKKILSDKNFKNDPRYKDQRGAMNNDPRYQDTRKNAMSGDSRYQDQRGTGSDPRYKDTRKNAMSGDSRYQDQRGTGSDPRYKDMRAEREREARRRKAHIHRAMSRKRSQRV